MTEARMEDEVHVLLTDTGTWFTRLIKLFTRAPYNHASLALDSSLKDVYSFGRKRAYNPFIAGFVKENVYFGTFRHFPDTRCVLLRVTLTETQRANVVQAVRQFEKNKDQYSYNLIGLLGVLFERDIQPSDSYFCSQFVAQVMQSSGIRLWERPSTQVTPHDFLKHEQFQVVYEGLLYEYPKLNRQRLLRSLNTKTNAIFFRKRIV